MNCPACDFANDPAARFCSNCGHQLGGLAEERRVVTVLFADLVGFTTLSERRDPEAVKNLVDDAFERLVRDVTGFGGRVDKIVGDAIVALFGAPVAHEDDAERAVRAALRMQETLAAYGGEAGIDIRMRVGVNTGEVLVGALRAGGDYTAMGDVVNLASRLQTAAEPGEVVVGDSTHAATEGAVSYEPRGHLTARGREQSERVWAATGTLRPPGPSRRTSATPLVGRDGELAVLLNASRGSIRHARGQIILLMGEAGVGKSRLAEEVAGTLAAEDGVAVFEGRCLPYGEVNPWWPVAEVVRDALRLDGSAGAEEARTALRSSVGALGVDDPSELTAIVDGLLHVLGYEGPLREMDGSTTKTEATRAVLAVTEARLRSGPVVVRIADLHWADDAVFELIDELSVRLARQPLVLLATARRSVQSRWTPRSGRFNSLVLNLDPLEREAVEQLLGHLTERHLDSGSVDQLVDRSGGNPFYLEELVTLLDQPLGAAEPVAEAGQFPETLRGLIAARIDALGADEQEVLGDAAVWGPSGPLAVLDRIADAARGVPSVAPTVQTLAEKDVLVVDGNRWSFRSDLVREITYARLTKSDRLAAHAGIATYLDRVADGTRADDATVEVVTRHMTEAALLAVDVGGDRQRRHLTERALHWLNEAAGRAERSGAWPSSDRLFARVLDLAGDDPELRARALLGRARARAEMWDHDGALADSSEALELAADLGSAEMRADGLLCQAAAHMRRAEWEATDRLLAEALSIHEHSGNTAGRGEVLRQQGLSQLLRGDHRAAEPPILAALECFGEVGDRRGEGWAFQSLAWIAFGDNQIARATGYTEASEEAFREAGDRGGMLWTAGLSAFILLTRGDFEHAREKARRVLAESERRGDRFGTGMMHVALGGADLWTGHPRAAVTAAEHALSHLDGDTDLVATELALTLQGRSLAMAGEVQRGFEVLRRALEVGRRTSTQFAQTVVPLTEVQLGLPGVLWAADGGDPDAQWPREAMGAVVGDAARALALVQRGRPDDAADMLADALVEHPADRIAAAVVEAATGRADAATARLRGIESLPGVTYHDTALAGVVRALLDPGPGGGELLAGTREELFVTEDRVMAALVELADAVRASAGAVGSSTTMGAAAGTLEAIGLGATRWRDVFEAIAASAPRVAQSFG